MPVKMVKTKVVKEMAKELFTLFSSKVNYILAQAISNDETSIARIDSKGNIQNDNMIYANDYTIQDENLNNNQDEIINELDNQEEKIKENKEKAVSFDEL